MTEEPEKISYLHQILCCVHLRWDLLLAPVTSLQQKLLTVVVLTSAEYFFCQEGTFAESLIFLLLCAILTLFQTL